MPREFSKEYVANLAVRVMLSSLGKDKWDQNNDKLDWDNIWEDTKKYFEYRCAYCGTRETDKKLQRDHLIQINKDACGLHHPGNIVPACEHCNNRDDKKTWKEKLKKICDERGEAKLYNRRERRILEHTKGRYAYPKLSEKESQRICGEAKKLYKKVTEAIENASER